MFNAQNMCEIFIRNSFCVFLFFFLNCKINSNVQRHLRKPIKCTLRNYRLRISRRCEFLIKLCSEKNNKNRQEFYAIRAIMREEWMVWFYLFGNNYPHSSYDNTAIFETKATF